MVKAGCWDQETHVEAFDDSIKFHFAPWFALTEEFGAQSLSPEWQVTEDDSVNEVVGCVAELFQGGDEGCLGENTISM